MAESKIKVGVLGRMRGIYAPYYSEAIDANATRDFALPKDWSTYLVVSAYTGAAAMWLVNPRSAGCYTLQIASDSAQTLSFASDSSGDNVVLSITPTKKTNITIIKLGVS